MLVNHILSRSNLKSPEKNQGKLKFQVEKSLQESEFKRIDDLIQKSNYKFSGQLNDIKKAVFNRLSMLDYMALYIINHIKQQEREDNDMQKIKQTINQLRKSLINASINQVQLSQKRRNNQQLKLKNQILKFREASMRQVLSSRNKDMSELHEKYKNLQNVITRMNIQRTNHKNQIMKLKATVQKLQRRIQRLKDSEPTLKGGNKIQTTLFQLIKQNDLNKKKQIEYNKTISKLNSDIIQIRNNSKIILDRLQSVKLRKGLSLAQDQDNPSLGFSLDNLQLSYQLKFRNTNQSYSQIIGSLTQMGTQKFVDSYYKSHYNQDQKLNTLKFFINQFTNNKQFSLDLNTLFIDLFKISQCPDIPSIMRRVATQGYEVFRSDRCHFWSVDNKTGIIYTFNSSSNQTRALSNNGLFKKMFKQQCAIRYYQQNQTLVCQQISKNHQLIRSSRTLLVPLKNRRGSIIAFLQLSKIREVCPQIQYYALILVKFIKMLLEIKLQNAQLKKNIKLSQNYLENFVFINSTNHRADMVIRTKKVALQLFDIQELQILFVDHRTRTFIRTDSNYPFKLHRIQYNRGISGQCFRTRSTFLCPNSLNHPKFNGEVDLVSVRPVNYILVFDEEQNNKLVSGAQQSKVIGIIQVAKLKKSPKEEDQEEDSYKIGQKGFMKEEQTIQKLTQLITMTLRARKNNWKE